ncbi:MAG: alpha/beta hydrolase [Planctomycetota bacterium]
MTSTQWAGALGSLILCATWFVPQPAVRSSIKEDVQFDSGGTKLAGSLVFPASGPVSAGVVFVHGSGRQERFLAGAERFARDGIAALVYDKRGVGQSEGEYEEGRQVGEENLAQLAGDALAAYQTLANHPKLKDVPLGLTGISQAGWIVPLTAARAEGVDFMVLWSGPVCKVSEEDIYSKHTRDLDTQTVPSYATALAARETPYVWPDFLGRDTDSFEDLAQLSVPGLWVFGAMDGSVPVDLSMQNLTQLRERSKPYEYVLFSASGHNNMVESFATVTDWIERLVRR